jgi:hypothetical protein
MTDNPPKCTCNKHDEDGNLIVYMGEGKPCISCKEREPCFDRFMKFVENRRENARTNSLNDPLCPYCKIPLRWEQFKEVWFCRTHGVFGDEMLNIPLPEKQFTVLDILEAWRNNIVANPYNNDSEDWLYTWEKETDFIKEIRENFEEVKREGIYEGWLK